MKKKIGCYQQKLGRLSFRLGILVTLAGAATAQVQANQYPLVDLSLEQLAQLRVTSVSKKAKPLADEPASVFVITEQDVRRAGSTTLAEALRLAPNLQVARMDARNYAVTARGFNNEFANKLLVLIDGRSVYSPLYSGVFWDAQDVVLEDLDRIEVISGPGGTLWGTNAVNGVVNIVTRSAADTQGEMVSLGGSALEQHAAVRYGGTIAGDGFYRVYAKHSEHDSTKTAAGLPTDTGWNRTQTGFRADWDSHDERSFTLQGDAYTSHQEAPGNNHIKLKGANVLGRISHEFSDEAKLTVQTYFDHTQRIQSDSFSQHLNTFDIELQHECMIGTQHTLMWGGGYRYVTDRIDDGEVFSFIPRNLNMQWRNVFVQDDITLTDDLHLALGAKWEDNPFTDWEFLPSMQLAWSPGDNQLLWSKVSRAVRTPSRIDRHLFSPAEPPVFNGIPLYVVAGGPQFTSEVATVYEVGYRQQPTPAFSWSMTLFRSEYEKLRTLEINDNGLNFSFVNGADADTRGVEVWGSWQANDQWRLHGSLVFQELDAHLRPGIMGFGNDAVLDNQDPEFYSSIRSSYDISRQVKMDATLRYVDKLESSQVPAYTALDVRVAWELSPKLELSLVGQNLLDGARPEFDAVPNRSEYERAFYGKLIWGL